MTTNHPPLMVQTKKKVIDNRIMKKEYMTPTMFVVNLEHQNLLLEVSGEGIGGGSEGSGSHGRSRSFDAWEDNWTEGWDEGLGK